jgi:hypothetical protein
MNTCLEKRVCHIHFGPYLALGSLPGYHQHEAVGVSQSQYLYSVGGSHLPNGVIQQYLILEQEKQVTCVQSWMDRYGQHQGVVG